MHRCLSIGVFGVLAVDAWVSVFEDEVRQIEARTCQHARGVRWE